MSNIKECTEDTLENKLNEKKQKVKFFITNLLQKKFIHSRYNMNMSFEGRGTTYYKLIQAGREYLIKNNLL